MAESLQDSLLTYIQAASTHALNSLFSPEEVHERRSHGNPGGSGVLLKNSMCVSIFPACGTTQLQKIREDLIKALAETKALKLDALAELAAKHQKLKSTEARCATLEAYLHHETAQAERCWSRAEAVEEANVALKEEEDRLKRERSQLELVITKIEERQSSQQTD